jgi:hypothetical protein
MASQLNTGEVEAQFTIYKSDKIWFIILSHSIAGANKQWNQLIKEGATKKEKGKVYKYKIELVDLLNPGKVKLLYSNYGKHSLFNCI